MLNDLARDAEIIGCCRLDVPAASSSLWLAWTSKGLRHCVWSPPKAVKPGGFGACEPSSLPDRYALLNVYLEGQAVDPVTLPVDPVGTPFQLRVWNALRSVPRGQVRSYGGIAKDVGNPRAMRAVGGANGKNPIAIVVPCHRIVAAGSGLGGYSSGLDRKRFLLELEGVTLVDDGVAPGQTSFL